MKIFAARYLLPIATPPVEDGALLVDNGRILAVAPRHELTAAFPRAAVVVYESALILPPLVNAHTHLELTDFPVWAEFAGLPSPPGDFVDWITHLVQVRRTVDDAAVRSSLCAGLSASLVAGTGAVGDILTTLSARPAYRHSALRGRVYAEVLGIDESRAAARLAEFAPHLCSAPDTALTWGLSPHAPYTLSPVTFERTLAFARHHRLPLAMHWAETAEELAFLAGGGGPLAERLYPLAGWAVPTDLPRACVAGSLPAGSLLIHGVHVAADRVDQLVAAGLAVVLCPRSNSRFGAARAPLTHYRRAGVPVALGTDSLASSPSLSIWDELAFARRWFAGVLAPADWLAIATAGGAAALGCADRMGHLAAGCEASFQVVALPAGVTAATLEEALCSGGDETRVEALYLGGQRIYDTAGQAMTLSGR
jgi:cytosine/adenosine deaminase-related metal-dependent hydrolase